MVLISFDYFIKLYVRSKRVSYHKAFKAVSEVQANMKLAETNVIHACSI